MGTQLGAQRRAGLLLAVLTCRSRCWCCCQIPGEGRAERARSGFNTPSTPRPQAWLPAPAFSPVLVPHTASCSCCQLGLEAPPAPSRAKASAVLIFAFCLPSHHFSLLFPFKSTFCAAGPACSSPPRHSLGSGTFWVSKLPPCEHRGRAEAAGAGVGSFLAWKESSLLAVSLFLFSWFLNLMTGQFCYLHLF